MWPTERRISRAKTFLTPSPIRPGSLWVELGAGYGTYILAMHDFIGDGWIVALELELQRVKFLTELVISKGLSNVLALRGDFYNPALRRGSCDGVLLANVLHFSSNPQGVIGAVHHILKKGGTLVVVEYTVSSPLPWVPYPLPKQKLSKLLETAAFQDIHLITENHRAYSLAAAHH